MQGAKILLIYTTPEVLASDWNPANCAARKGLEEGPEREDYGSLSIGGKTQAALKTGQTERRRLGANRVTRTRSLISALTGPLDMSARPPHGRMRGSGRHSRGGTQLAVPGQCHRNGG